MRESRSVLVGEIQKPPRAERWSGLFIYLFIYLLMDLLVIPPSREAITYRLRYIRFVSSHVKNMKTFPENWSRKEHRASVWALSGHRPDRRQARHVHILQIGLRLAIAQTDARPAMSISFR